jgi:hypothetical protein
MNNVRHSEDLEDEAAAVLLTSLRSFREGLGAHISGVAFILSQPPLLRMCLPAAGISVAMATCLAICLWISCLLLRLPPLSWTVSLNDLLLISSLIVMYTYQQFWPSGSGRVFFCALAVCSEHEADKLAAMPVVRGLVAQLRSIVRSIVLGIGMLLICLAAAPILLPILTFGVVVAAGILPFLIIPLASCFLLLAFFYTKIEPAIHAISALGNFGRVRTAFAAFFILIYIIGLVPKEVVDMISEASWGYMLSVAHAQHLLCQVSVRMSSREWDDWCAVRRTTLAGFGMPVWAMMKFGHPLLGLLLLEVQYGATAVFLCGQVQHIADFQVDKSKKV